MRRARSSSVEGPSASFSAATNWSTFPATATLGPCSALNRRISGRSVATTGMPIARYSFSFVGYTLAVYSRQQIRHDADIESLDVPRDVVVRALAEPVQIRNPWRSR